MQVVATCCTLWRMLKPKGKWGRSQWEVYGCRALVVHGSTLAVPSLQCAQIMVNPFHHICCKHLISCQFKSVCFPNQIGNHKVCAYLAWGMLTPCQTSEMFLIDSSRVAGVDISTSSSGATLPYPLFLSHHNAGEIVHQLKHSPKAHDGQDGGA